jgi:hypothetical protein
VQVLVGSACAVRVIKTSPFPSPATAPNAVKVRPLSAKLGFLFGGLR